ncbi:MAG: tRNA (adenosine(37)-N6)-threonylcarbamoyltransferase complex transferase subunit TsaD [Deinococcota bacterium]|nr:tRNA (adenosine(37)-N6)-threonylcarbamoyltransferase complex transferase subunit TsaD [Deinococcota bacterium]
MLGIDTSCDDTGVGLVRGHTVLANVVASQTALHAPYGGVMPEQASREHLAVIDAVLGRALAAAGLGLDEVDAVAATHGPGLVGALLVGLGYAKALAWARALPFVAVHHLEGHIASSLAGADITPPFLCLIASGGHSSLFTVRAWGDYLELGRSRDDAAGEAFDKVARLLGLGYPGGPELSRLAAGGDPARVPLPLPMKGQKGFDFSFSGLKTAVSLLLQRQPEVNRADLAASFEHVVVESLFEVTRRAAAAHGHSQLVVAGGVAANRRLRERFSESGLAVFFPPLELATDNGAMIALAAQGKLAAARTEGWKTDGWELDASPYLPLGASP